MSIIYVVENHDQVFDLWKTQNKQFLHVLHLDAHCDLRGLLIDRQAQTAYKIWDKNPKVDPGNFLTHAVLEGRIRSIRWVYGDLGGRKFDVGTVKYESDLTAWPYRFLLALRGVNGIPIHYEAMPFGKWAGLNEGEYLDIDWDFFAHPSFTENTIQEYVDAFLRINFLTIPEHIYVCYSPDFSLPSRSLFQRFINDLSIIFKAQVVELPSGSPESTTQMLDRNHLPSPFFRLIRLFYYKVNLALRKRGIF